MVFNIYEPNLGSVVWIGSGEYARWPGKIILPKNKFNVPENCFRIGLYGIPKKIWVPKQDVSPYRFPTNSEGYPICLDWIRAVQEAENVVRGIILIPRRSSSTRNTFFAPPAIPGPSTSRATIPFDEPEPPRKVTQVIKCCGKAKVRERETPYPAKRKGPCVFIEKLPDVVLNSTRIKPINHRDCVGSNGDQIGGPECLRCEVETVKIDKYQVGIFDTTGSFAKDIGNCLLGKLVKKLFVCEQEPECEQWIEIEKRGGACLKSIDFFVNSCDLMISCAPTSDVVREILLSRLFVYPYVPKDKVYVFFTPMKLDLCLDINEVVTRGGSRFLDAVLVNKKDPGPTFAEKHVLLISGDKSAYTEFKHLFQEISKTIKYLGPAGEATKMNMVHGLLIGGLFVSFAEVFQFAKDLKMLSNDNYLKDFHTLIGTLPNRNEMQSQYISKTDGLPSNLLETMQKGNMLALKNGIAMPVVKTAYDRILQKIKGLP